MNKLYVFYESSYNVACIALFFKSNKKKIPSFRAFKKRWSQWESLEKYKSKLHYMAKVHTIR